MALNLSTLTSPATSGDVLAEALTTADFLEPVPVLRNLARGSNKGGDAEQAVALNQPKALPLIKNPAGDLGGYLYIPDVAGNYATGPSVTIGANETWEGELDMVITQWGNYILPMGGGNWAAGFGLIFYNGGDVRAFSKGSGGAVASSGVTFGTPFNVKYGFDGTNLYVDIDDSRVYQLAAPDQSGSITHTLEFNQQALLTNVGNYAIQKAKLTVNSAVVFDCDFNGSTSIRHGDQKWKAAVGGPVVLTTSSNDPATVIKKPVLRFDGVNDFMDGVFGQTLTGGYFFAAFSVLGGGGDGYGRIFGAYSTGGSDGSAGGFAFRRNASTSQMQVLWNGGTQLTHDDVFNGARGDFLLESPLRDGDQNSLINNADADDGACSRAGSLSSEEFNIASGTLGGNNPSIDLEYLALFPATITDDQADAVRNYINNRNNVFYRWDTDGFYFFDPQKATFTGNFTDANTLDGYITGSDLGDTDVRTNLTLEQATLNDQPSTDGYTITFNDSAEHLEFVNAASQALAGWQIVGTSLGTFAYRVNANAVTELNLLGNAGGGRTVGDSYGMILLPESATGREIEEARKLLIDRGAADGATSSSYIGAWYLRQDMVEFKSVNMSAGTNFQGAWQDSGLTSFPSLDLSSGTTFLASWAGAPLQDFGSVDCSQGTNFTSAWFLTTSLTSFPADAKLGTEATNVNFQEAWQSSGLTSFNTPLPTATTVRFAWKNCTSLTSFSSELPLVTNVYQAWINCTSLTSFSSELPSAADVRYAWYNCNSLTSFDTSLPSATNVYAAWNICSSLTDFSADVFANWNPSSINSGIFNDAWTGCTSLTAQSVENILTSIDASGQYATSTGASGGSALADAGIDIDYNGDPLTAATTAAIDSLSGKGWQVYINGELVIPNILDLEPAAAYSLRSFDADADPNVVNVRRSSDNATSDFTASEVSDGTLVAFVGAGNDGHVTTWYDQGGTNHATQATASSQPKIVDGGTLVTENGLPSINFHTEVSNLSLDHSDLYGQATLDSYYVTNTTDTQYLYPACGSGSRYGMVAESGSSLTILSEIYGNPSFYANGSQITGGTRDAIYTATSGGQKLVAHQGAGTTDLSWASSMNFGNYQNLTDYSYTGKLQEMIFFNTDQSTNRTGIENNINDHFDIYS